MNPGNAAGAALELIADAALAADGTIQRNPAVGDGPRGLLAVCLEMIRDTTPAISDFTPEALIRVKKNVDLLRHTLQKTRDTLDKQGQALAPSDEKIAGVEEAIGRLVLH